MRRKNAFRHHGRAAPGGLALTIALGGIALTLNTAMAADEDEIVPVGLQKQLFVDDYAIADMTGVRRVAHSPQKYPGNPVLRGERPWERGVLHPLAVAYDPAAGLFHLYYRATSAPPGHPARESLCYARSSDGIHWEKPDLDFVQLTDEEGGTPNNLLPSTRTPMAVYVDPEEKDPSKRFLGLFSGEKPASVSRWYSADGVTWTEAGGSGDLRSSASRTPPDPNARYFYTGQCWAGRNSWGANRRGVMRADSDDCEHWGGNRTIFAAGPGDPENLEFYTMSVADMRMDHTYCGLHLGFLHHFHTDLAGKHHPSNNVAMSGPIDVYLVASRDTVEWQHVDEENPFLPLGPEGAFDSGMIFLCSMVEHSGRLLFYYDGWNVEHGQLIGTPTREGHAQVGLATLRLDGFVSLEPEGQHGTVTTRPFVVAGGRLLVNVDARRGKLLADALDESGRPLAGFSEADCEPLSEDGVRVQVKWRNHALSELQGRAVRLRFHLRGAAALYAVQVAPAGE